MNKYKELIVIATAASTLMSIPVFAESVQHEVQQGDTLYSISQQYSTTVDTLKELNNLDSDNITVGDTLVVKEVEESPEEPEIDTGTDDAINDTESNETLTTVDSTTEDGYIRDDKTFTSVSDALVYGRSNFDYKIHKEFYVNWVGPNQYVLDWEMLDSYWDEEPTPEDPKPEDPEEPTQPEEEYIRDDKTFTSVEDALVYGRSNFDYKIHKEFYVNWVGPNQYVLDWEMLDSYWDEEPTPEEPKPGDPKPEDPKPEDPKPEDPKPEDPEEPTQTEEGYIRDDKTFTTVDEAVDYGRANFDYTIHKEFYVNWVGPNQYVLDWEMLDSYWDEEPGTPEEPETPETPEEGVIYYQVKAGDYLYRIANKFNITVQELKDFNNLESNLIHPGDSLIVGYAVEDEPETPENPDKPETPDKPSFVYTVKHGDYLYKIATRFNVTVDQIKEWNDLDSNLLFSGDELVIHTESTSVKEPVYYTVKAGDYLYKIANLNNTTVDQLMDWNDLTHSLIYPGDVLVVGMK